MLTKKKILLLISVLIASVLIYVFTPWVASYFRWQRAIKAASSFPYQIGLTNTQITWCVVSCNDSCCQGARGDQTATALCNTKGPGVCANYAYVSGTPAGGMGSGALFPITMMGEAGVSTGGQLIAGGMGPTLMDSGVLAAIGCAGSGCAFSFNFKNKIRDWFYNFIIAGNRNN
jgi:hypothetical protein